MELFEPFRVIGSVCGSVPVSATTLYGVAILMVATGRTYQLYKGKELALIRGGPTFECHITAVAQSGKYRCVAEGPRIHVLVHHKPLWTDFHEALTNPTVHLLLAQDDLLFCAGSDKRVVIRAIKTGEVLQEILVAESASVTQMVLPTGYNNKLLLGTEEGMLMLYNFKTGELLWHDYPAITNEDENKVDTIVNGNFIHNKHNVNEYQGSITALTSSSYKDIIAYGTSFGSVVVMNLATNTRIANFTHETENDHYNMNNYDNTSKFNSHAASITALAFRTDRDGFLLSATAHGEVAIWDLHERCLDGILARTKQVRTLSEVLDPIHRDEVHSLITFTQPTMQSLVISAGCDNALMQFRFDTIDGTGMLVRERRGHAGDCAVAIFYNSDLILSAGGNGCCHSNTNSHPNGDYSLRVTHLFSDRASWELSQGKLGKRSKHLHHSRDSLQLPAITHLASCTTRHYQWSSVVSTHCSSSHICGWRMDSRHVEFKLSGIKTSSHVARAIAVSECGNFALVGYSSGNVTRINLQNKSVHQLFDRSLSNYTTEANNLRTENEEAYLVERAHWGSVECVEVACGNSIIVTAGIDQTIKMWSLLTCELRQVLHVHGPLTKSCVHQASSLIILAQHHDICVYHCNPDAGLSVDEMQSPVRQLRGHQSSITALALAPDTFRYVVSSSSDGVLLVWDLAAAACVGQYRLHSPALSLCFHPDALFLLSTHAGESGVCAWVNNLRYGFVPEVVVNPTEISYDKLKEMHFPTSHGNAELDEFANEDEDKRYVDQINTEKKCIDNSTNNNLTGSNYILDDNKSVSLTETSSAQATRLCTEVHTQELSHTECNLIDGEEQELTSHKKDRELEFEFEQSDTHILKSSKTSEGKTINSTAINEEVELSKNINSHTVNLAHLEGDNAIELFDIRKDVALRREQAEKQKQRDLDAITTCGIRLSGIPRLVWWNLTLLDAIREKNQPILPPKKKDVPFFLQSTQVLRPTFIIAASETQSTKINHEKESATDNGMLTTINTNENNSIKESRQIKDDKQSRITWIDDITSMHNGSKKVSVHGEYKNKNSDNQHLIKAELDVLTSVLTMLFNNEFDILIQSLLNLKTAQAIDLEIKNLIDFTEGASYTKKEIQLMSKCIEKFVDFITYWVRRRQNVDLVQGLLRNFLRTYTALLCQLEDEVVKTFDMLLTSQDEIRRILDHLISYPNSLSNQVERTCL